MIINSASFESSHTSSYFNVSAFRFAQVNDGDSTIVVVMHLLCAGPRKVGITRFSRGSADPRNTTTTQLVVADGAAGSAMTGRMITALKQQLNMVIYVPEIDEDQLPAIGTGFISTTFQVVIPHPKFIVHAVPT